MTVSWTSVERVSTLGGEEFYREYVRPGKPVVIEKLTAEWPALEWTPDLFRRIGPNTRVAIKQGDVADGKRHNLTLSSYIDALNEHEARPGQPANYPGYLHDVPLFGFFPNLVADVAPFPLHLLPNWYRAHWYAHTQHFIGPAGSVTPLHFDTLLTNNLFFHLHGRKQFILIPAEQKQLCYPRGWRWADFDPVAPDYDTFPQAKEARPVSVVLEPGDVLYMPPGTLHHVTNLSTSISFNIDWHTRASARRGIASVAHGAPWKNGYYNALSYLGLALHVPERLVFRFYKSYLTYIS